MKVTPSLSPTRLCFLVSILLLFFACTARKKSPQESPDLSRLAAMMQGSFTSSAQAQRDTAYFDVSLEMFPIWEKRKDGRWIYVEQALSALKGKPYRQRIYHLTQRADGSFISEVFSLPDETSFVGAYLTPEKFDALSPEQLNLRDGCAVILHKEGEGFAGATEGNGCESNLRGAKYASSKVEISQGRIHSWDQGFDASGKQVWGATKGPYEFIKK